MNYKIINNKKLILSFILFSIGLLIPLFYVSPNLTFWQKLYDIYTNEWYILMMFLSSNILLIDYYNLTSNENIILRQNKLKEYIDTNTKYIIKYMLYFLLTSLLFTIIISIIQSNFTFTSMNIYQYKIPIYIYDIFIIIRFIVLMILLTIILYYLNWSNQTLFKIIITLISILILFDINIIINDKPLFITTIVKGIKLSNFNNELVYTLSYILFLLLIMNIIYYYRFIYKKENKNEISKRNNKKFNKK